MTDYHRFNALKILAYSDRLRRIAAGAWPPPNPIDWHIYASNLCNHACAWCMFRQNGEQFDYAVKLPREVLLRAVRDAAAHDAALIHFSGGGEPLLNRFTLEAMTLAQELGAARQAAGGLPLRVALSTNGSRLSPEVAAQVDYIRVSLNAGTATQHHATNHAGDPRHPGDWARILDNLRASAPHRRQDLGLAFVVDADNYPDIPAFCAIGAEVGADFVHIRPAFWYDEAKDARMRAAMPDVLAVCDRARAELAGHPLKIYAITEKFDGYWSPRTYDRCQAVLTGITLRATGDFSVCQDRTDLTFGHDYRRGASFAEVWGGEQHRALVASIHAGEGGQLDACPRCVWNQRNVILQDVFGDKDVMRLSLV
jgi:wyosine [tRNA(Phe)-imidazoG37] synthetase (radical SAM superfamily)